MKIGLTQTFLEKSADFTNSYTLASISAWVKRTIPDVEVIYSADVNELLGCDEIWCTSTSDAWNKVNELGKMICSEGKKFVVGGHHATALPQTLKYGTAYRGPLESYKHLDELPLPDWSIFRENKNPVMMTSRSCPYKCNFCSSQSFWGKYQAKSPEKVIEEINYLKSLGAKQITIFDDLFTANKNRLKKIVELIRKEELDYIEYSCLVRSNLVDKPTIDLLKVMNVKHLAFGAESGSDRILEAMNKKTTVKDNQRAIDLLDANGLKPTMSFIAGYEGETLEDLELTRRFIEKNREKSDIIEVYPCIPFPGTRLWDSFVQHNDVHSLDNFDWESLSLTIGNIRRDKYNMLTDNYSKSDLFDFISWNETEKQSLQKRRSPETKRHPGSISSVSLNLFARGNVRKSIHHIRTAGFKSFLMKVKSKLFATSDNADKLDNQCTAAPTFFPESVLAHKYCKGKGLEIGGSAHNPFGLNTLNVDMTDSMNTSFKKEEIKLCGRALKVDIVAKGDEIPLPDESQDFIVSSHVLEHFPNPIKALIEWDRLVRPGGIIFMIVPHRDRIFDRDRDRTSLSHLIDDFKNDNIKPHGDPGGHDHVWKTEDVLEVIHWMIDHLHVNWKIMKVQDVDDKVGNGFTIVIRKKGVNLAQGVFKLGGVFKGR